MTEAQVTELLRLLHALVILVAFIPLVLALLVWQVALLPSLLVSRWIRAIESLPPPPPTSSGEK